MVTLPRHLLLVSPASHDKSKIQVIQAGQNSHLARRPAAENWER
jgi:hypothetical protein